MSHQSRLRRWLSVNQYDVVLAKLGLVLSVLLLGLRLFASQVFLLVIPVASGIGSLLYLLTANGHRALSKSRTPTLPAGVVGHLPALVVVGLAVLVGSVWSGGGRTISTHLLTGVIGTLILLQILFVDDDQFEPVTVLAQVLVAAVVIRLSALYATPGFVGVDIWTHLLVYVDGIVRAESLSAIADTKHIMAPVYHAYLAVATPVFGSVRSATYASMGVLVPLSALFVYATGNLLVPARWALLATALYTFADQFVRWGLHLIPTSLGLVFFLVTVYAVTKVLVTDADRWVVGLLLASALAVVFTHQVSTAILLVFLGVAVLVDVAVRVFGGSAAASGSTRSTVALAGAFALTLAVTAVAWANTPFSGNRIFLWSRLNVIAEAIQSAGFLDLAGGASGATGGQAPAASPSPLSTLVPYIDVFGFVLLLTITVLGGLVVLSWDRRLNVGLTYAVASGLMFVAVFGLSVFGIRTHLPGRWKVFMYALMAIVGAVGLYYLWQNVSRGTVLAVALVLAIGYPTTMVVAEKATLDSPTFDDEHVRFSYTEAEIAAMETLGATWPAGEQRQLYTDHPYLTIYGSAGGFDARIAVMNESGTEPLTAGPIVYRQYQSDGAATLHAPGPEPKPAFQQEVTADVVCPDRRNHIYANDQVRLCSEPNLASGEGS